MLGLWTFLTKTFRHIQRISDYTQPHIIIFRGHTSPCKHRWPRDSWSWPSSYSTVHLCLSFSAHFPPDYTLWVCFIWLTESFVQPKSLHNVYFTWLRVKKKKSVVQYTAPIEKKNQLYPLFFSKYLSLLFSTVRQTQRLKGIPLSISLLWGMSTREEYSMVLMQ